jgi:phosphatidylserine decarboxylase
MKFLKLYRECLTFLQAEVKEKKRVLDTAQLAFMTADPGIVQQTVASHINSYKKKKKP